MEAAMTKEPDSNRSSSVSTPARNAGGVFIAVGGILGAVLGGFLGQPSIGLLVGLGLGTAIALAVWLTDR